MRKKWFITIAIVIALIAIAIGLNRCKKAKTKASQATDIDASYTVGFGDISAKIEITGEVQAKTVVAIKSRVSGKIVKFYADENDQVAYGQKIADIEPDYNQANTLYNTKANLQTAELRLEKARKDIADKKILLDKAFLSQADYDAADDELKSAEITYAQAKSQYEMIRDMDIPGKVIPVYATASGTVIERKVNEGEMVTSSINAYGEGTVIMKIADLSRMIIKSNINEVDIAKFHVGQQAEISLDALPYDSYEGKVVKIAPMAISENSAKVFPVEISINANGKIAKPGMTAAVSIIGEARTHVLTIPISAVFSDDKNQDIVYLMPKTKTTQKEPKPSPVPTVVRLGANDFQKVEVISGLAENDKISMVEPASATKMNMMMN